MGSQSIRYLFDTKSLKKTMCICPFVKENDIICKQMFSVYFKMNLEYIDDFLVDEKRCLEDKVYRYQRDK